jgi:hypothetical protein
MTKCHANGVDRSEHLLPEQRKRREKDDGVQNANGDKGR